MKLLLYHNVCIIYADCTHFQCTGEDTDHTEGGWGWGLQALRPQGQQLATTPLSGEICTAVPRLERHSRCLSSSALRHKERKREEGVEKKRLGCWAGGERKEKKSCINRHRNVISTSEKRLNIDHLSPGRWESQLELAEVKAETCPDVNHVSVCATSSLNMCLVMYSSGVSQFLFDLYSGSLIETKISLLLLFF